MKLQILVPHHKETPSEIKPLLDSIAIQQQVDFDEVGVIIAHDGPEATPLPKGSEYPFEIKQIKRKHQGVSATRNAALDAAKAEYVMFCDADDMFCHACGLFIIMCEIKVGFDTLTSCFIEQTKTPNGEFTFINHDMDSTFVHGKVHRRKYLLEKQIRFNPDLTIHEDSYFNILAQNLTENAKYCPTPFYLWRWRDNSVCRHDKDYILKTYNNMLDSNDALVEKFIERGYEDKACFYIGFMIFDAYYTMNKREWIDKTNKGYRDAVEKRFALYYKKYRPRFESLSEQERMIISNGVRSRSVGEGMQMEIMTIGAWLEHVQKIQEGKNDE